MRALYIDCGQIQSALWQDVLPGYDIKVDRSSGDFDIAELPQRLEGYDICISDHTRIPGGILERCSAIKHFIYFGTGAASILDLKLADRMGIKVHTIRNYGDTTVAELAVAMMMAGARQLAAQHSIIREGGWTKMRGIELKGRRIGLIGFGGIGQEMSRICAGIGMDVVTWNRAGAHNEHSRYVILEELLESSDVVSLHLGLNEDTHGFLNRSRIQSMKPSAILVNTARGALLDEDAVVEALTKGQLGHAALDVFEVEPLPENSKLRTTPNVTLTAHCGFWTQTSSLNQVHLVMDIVRSLQSSV